MMNKSEINRSHFDITISVPMSVSLAILIGDNDKVFKAHDLAAKHALKAISTLKLRSKK